MWRGNHDYFLCLRSCFFGRIETVLLRQAEGSACSWTSPALWLRHKNAEWWRRDKQWYRDVSQRNASTAWRTISFFGKILPFLLRLTNIYLFSGFLWFYILATSFGIPWRINWSLDWKESTICTPFTFTFCPIVYNSLNQILPYGSFSGKLSEQLAERIQSSGLGMIAKWCPQQFILNHPVWLFLNCYLSKLNT